MELPGPGAFVASVAIWAALAMVVFAHAEKHGSKRPTAWGIATFLLGPFGAGLYFARHWLRRRRS